MAVFPLGSANITNDMAIGLRTEVAAAEDIKKEHGTCILTGTDSKNPAGKVLTYNGARKKDTQEKSERRKIEIFDNSNSLSFGKKYLVSIIEPRVSEILSLIQKELKSVGLEELLPGGIVLTGGGVKLPKLKDLVKQQLKLPCQIGIPKGIAGLDDDPALATVAGLVLGSTDFETTQRDAITRFIRGLGLSFKRMFKVFIP